MSVITAGARDSSVVTWRNLMNVRRQPDLLLGATLQPIMFVLLFAFVFGNSIGDDPDAYRQFLMGGIFAQTVAFNSAYTTIGMAADLEKGVIDRFRSLPMSRSAVLIGRTTSDLVVSALGLVVMSICGLIVGWRISGGFLEAVAAYAIMLLFSFAMSWIGAWIGMVSGSVQVAQSAGFIWMFPVSFISSAFVSASSMPGPLKVIAEWNPITAVADAARDLFGNQRPGVLATSDVWPAQHAVLYAILSCIGVLVIFAPLAVSKYRKVASK
ncbi:ABC transporter permease [Actinokineospora auranticolor]|uniref:Transport permease protein n=1 Tax=Actinokineospora auranticolor TaxID=155976 RepID=A0A2S6GBW2_9PSEU|nr:ABC transporter permease [Actinokineospora auranticolor]PPK61716.1 ABC transporter DrrB family efflux protein [Actinokineospora auranticolor]